MIILDKFKLIISDSYVYLYFKDKPYFGWNHNNSEFDTIYNAEHDSINGIKFILVGVGIYNLKSYYDKHELLDILQKSNFPKDFFEPLEYIINNNIIQKLEVFK